MRLDSLLVLCALLLLGGIAVPAHGNAPSPQSDEEEQLHQQLEGLEGLQGVQSPEIHVHLITLALEDASRAVNRSDSAVRQDKLAEALRLANEFVQEHPNDWRSHFHLYRAHEARKDHAAAIGALEAALKIASDTEGRQQVGMKLGRIYEDRQEWAKALKVYQRTGAKGMADRVTEIIALLAPHNDPAERQRVLDEYFAREEHEARELEEQLKSLDGGG